jgi:rhodanese-related sulfurtransferase
MHTFNVIIMHAFVAAQARKTVLEMKRTSDDLNSIDKFVDRLADKLMGKVIGLVPASASSPFRGSMWSMPQYRSSLDVKTRVAPYRDWREGIAQSRLAKQGLSPISPERALKMVNDDEAIMVDVRPETGRGKPAYAKPQGAVSVPLFREVPGNSPINIMKRVVTGVALGKAAQERNPDFMPNLQEKMTALSLDDSRTVIVACNRGGTTDFIKSSLMNPSCYTQSLVAAEELYEAGFKKVRILQGGVGEWEKQGLPMADGNENDPKPN